MALLLRRSALASLMAMALMLIAAPAFAGEKGDKTKGLATLVTEDNDNDGQPNTPDPEGDDDNMHPSGNDKSAESGGSGNQGKSGSTPDQNGKGPERDHEGTDKPSGSGGVDKLDQDGNNGCGNDDDFEDDNEGNCGGKTKPAKPPKPTTDSTTSGGGASSGTAGGAGGTATSSQTISVSPDSIAPPTIVSDATAMGDIDAPTGPTEVLSGTAAAPAVEVLASELAFTGLNLSSLLFAMGVLALIGAAFLVASRRRSRA
jgi:hypothetical protein